MKKLILTSLILSIVVSISAQQKIIPYGIPSGFNGLYFNQEAPDSIPEIFGPGIISTGLNESTCAVSPDGREIYFVISIKTGNRFLMSIAETKLVNGNWTKPEVASFSGLYQDHGPFIDPGGKRMYFASDRPLVSNGKPGNTNIWYMNKTENGWDDPVPLGTPVNGDYDAMSASVSKSGTLYFTISYKDGKQDLFRSKMINNSYNSIERLPDVINSGRSQFDGCISPDESYLIYCMYDRKDAVGSTDYYVSFRDEKDNWSIPVNLGSTINTKDVDCTPTITSDGKYIFLGGHLATYRGDEGNPVKYDDFENILNSPGCGGFDILWVSSRVIDKLKNNK